MNRWITQCILVFCMIIASGCSTYHRQNTFPVAQLKKLHSHYAPIPKGQIEYYRFGQGSPIVLIPGYTTDISSWNRDFLAALAHDHQVIVFNNRDVGGSYVNSSRYESQDLASDTYQLIKFLRLKKPAILGISMGGMIAQQVAALYPDKISQLILINTAIAGKQAVHPTPTVEKKMLNMPKNKLGRYTKAVTLFFPPSWRMRMAYGIATDRFLPQQYHEINPSLVMQEQQHLVMEWVKDDVTAKKISKLKTPTLILNGEADVVIPPINSVILAKTIPHTRLLRWKDGGHAMIYQYPVEIANSVNEFIAGTKT